jgi:hypothetical protein
VLYSYTTSYVQVKVPSPVYITSIVSGAEAAAAAPASASAGHPGGGAGGRTEGAYQYAARAGRSSDLYTMGMQAGGRGGTEAASQARGLGSDQIQRIQQRLHAQPEMGTVSGLC